MFRNILFFLALAGSSALAQNRTENRWSAIRTPTDGTPQAIGGYANGCQTGAQTLPESGAGYVSIRRDRKSVV